MEGSSAAVGTRYPEHLMLELTDRCNLKCMICVREEYEGAIGGPGTMMDLADIEKLRAPIQHAKTITVTGFGETFLHPNLHDILKLIYDINPSDNLIKIVTNGTALGIDKAPWFAGHLHSIAVSLNAANPESYAREMHPYEVADGRDVANKFSRLTDRIVAFADGLPPQDRSKVHLHYVVHRNNIRDMPDFVRLAHSMGLSTVNFTHFKVHREKNISDSIYWYKDDYNDAYDEACEVGAKLGVSVGGRKFFTEKPKQFVPEADCTWPIDTAIVGVKGRITPCCYWTGNEGAANVFDDGFDSVWFSDFYERLRIKRDAKPCQTCNILHVFDDMILHFSPGLKSDPNFIRQMGHLREPDAADRERLSALFGRLGLDLSLYRWTLRQTVGDVALINMALSDENALAKIGDACFARFAEQALPAEDNVSVYLGARFLGLGWGPIMNNATQKWRWLGTHGQPSSIYVRLSKKEHWAEIDVMTTDNPTALQALKVEVNRSPVHSSMHFRDGRYRLAFEIPENLMDDAKNGAVAIGVSIDRSIAPVGNVAFERLETRTRPKLGFVYSRRRGLVEIAKKILSADIRR